MDAISGTAKDDYLTGTSGDDLILGRDGNDTILDDLGGSDSLKGNAGDDSITVVRSSEDELAKITVLGGADNDWIYWDVQNDSAGQLDGGDGDDEIAILANGGNVIIKTGSGSDTIHIDELSLRSVGSITVAEFSAKEDSISWTSFLERNLTNWDGSNPFSSGHARLVQSGGSVLLQIDYDGGGDRYSTLMTFNKAKVGMFTAENFGGYPPDGAKPEGATFVGGNTGDTIFGTVGDDHLSGSGGVDFIEGAAGDDVISGGSGRDYLVGGMGDDLVHGDGGDDYFVDGYVEYGRKSKITGDLDYGSDTLYGDGGNDTFEIGRSQAAPTMSVKAYGGSGADTFLYGVHNDSRGLLNGGAGEDTFQIVANGGDLTITTGAGRDLILLDDIDLSAEATITVTDFTVGRGGDVLSFAGLLARFESENPFADGYVNVVQIGKDAVMQIDVDGGGDDFFDLVILKNVDYFQMTEDNLFAKPPEPFRLALLDDSDHILG